MAEVKKAHVPIKRPGGGIAAAKKVAPAKVAPRPVVKPKDVWTTEMRNETIHFMKNGRSASSFNCDIDGVNCSCGTQSISGITQFPIGDRFGIPEEVLIEGLKKWIAVIKAEYQAAFLLASNNKTELINAIFSKVCLNETEYKQSPKTQEMIKIWVL
jgi:hypothetical protein